VRSRNRGVETESRFATTGSPLLAETSLVAPITAQHTSFHLDAIPRFQDFFRKWIRNEMIGLMKATLKRWHPVAIALSVSATVVVLGCSGDESGLARRYKVTGKVTYKGAALARGTINFLPTKPPPPEGRAAQGEINDGVYSLSTTGNSDGALPGEYNVAIVAKEMDLQTAAAANKEGIIHQGDAAHQKAIKNAKSLIPPKYTTGETSKLTATVKTSANEFNFDLKDD